MNQFGLFPITIRQSVGIETVTRICYQTFLRLHDSCSSPFITRFKAIRLIRLNIRYLEVHFIEIACPISSTNTSRHLEGATEIAWTVTVCRSASQTLGVVHL